MNGSERKAAAHSVGAAVAEVSTAVEQIQLALLPAQRIRLNRIHRAVRAGARTAGLVTGAALDLTASPTAASVADTPRGAAILAGLECAFGDSLAASGSALATRMAIRVHSRAVPLRRTELRHAFPGATPKLAVFLHGLGGTEHGWGVPFSYGDHLRHDFGYTPVMIRYNSGVAVHRSGADLDALLTALIREWPVSIEDVVIVSHSMGGLVARSAGAVAAERDSLRDSPWAPLVSNMVFLATPHFGSPVERAAHTSLTALSRRAPTAPIASLANSRSAAIKDLRHGSITAADVAHGDPHRRELGDHLHVALLPTARHTFISSTLLSPRLGRFSEAVGDALVPSASALAFPASGSRLPHDGVSVHRLRGLHHNQLLRSDEVYAIIAAAVSG